MISRFLDSSSFLVGSSSVGDPDDGGDSEVVVEAASETAEEYLDEIRGGKEAEGITLEGLCILDADLAEWIKGDCLAA